MKLKSKQAKERSKYYNLVFEMSNDRKGLHIVFEGLDGGGKSTQAEILTERLREDGYSVYNWREALKDEEMDEDMSRIVWQMTDITSDPRNTNMAVTAETMIYAARMAQVIDEGILPHLKAGDIVISVRCRPTLQAIFHFIRGVDRKFIERINEFISKEMWTDLVVLCDSEPEKAWQNVESRDEPPDRRELEGLPHFEKMREGFLKLAEENPENWHVVNTLEHSVEESAEKIWEKVRPLVEEWEDRQKQV